MVVAGKKTLELSGKMPYPTITVTEKWKILLNNLHITQSNKHDVKICLLFCPFSPPLHVPFPSSPTVYFSRMFRLLILDYANIDVVTASLLFRTKRVVSCEGLKQIKGREVRR